MWARARPATVRLALSTTLAVSAAAAGAQAVPFRDTPVAITAAFGTERTLARVTALGSAAGIPAADAQSLTEVAAAAVADDLPLFRASLERKDAALAGALVRALASLQAAGGVQAARVARAETLTRRAADALEAGLPGDAARATVLGLVLTGPDGLSDTFGAAVDDGDRLGMATAWALLQRSHALWRQLQGAADEAQRQTVESALGRLDALVPGPASDRQPAPGSGDESENDANQVVATLGAALHASLTPDSDLAGLAATVEGLASGGCAAQDAAASQQLAVGTLLYTGYLSPTATMLAPEDDAAVQQAFASLARSSGSRSGDCAQLSDALSRVRAALGG